MSVSGRSELKTGKRPVQKALRAFKPGEVIFEEGSRGRELCIIEAGVVGVYKETGEGQIELARIPKGGVIGEMSLLDNLPRSATVKAIETTRALMINQQVFLAITQKLPAWLNSIIKIVVSRLRDANKRVDQSVLRDKERGLASLLLLLLPQYKYEVSSTMALGYNLLSVEAYYVCRLKKKDIARLIDALAKKGIVEVQEDTERKKHVLVADIEVLRLYEEYLSLKSQKKTFREASVPEDAVTVLSNIAYVAQKLGRETPEGTTLLKSALLDDLKEKDPKKVDKTLLELSKRSLVSIAPQDNDALIVFQKKVLTRLKKIKEWLPKFEAV